MILYKVILQNEILFEKARFVTSFWGKLFGLMFKKSYDSDKQGAIVFKNAFWIHSFFVFLPFNALYLDKNFNIVGHHKNIRPFTLLPPVWFARYIVEYTGEPKNIKGQVEFVEE